MDRNKKSRLVLFTWILGILVFSYSVDYFFFKAKRDIANAELNAKFIATGIANRISEMLQSYKSIADETAYTLNNTDSLMFEKDDLLNDIVDFNDNVYGCLIANLPDSTAADSVMKCRYCYKENNKVCFVNIEDSVNLSIFYKIKSMVIKEPIFLDATIEKMNKKVEACYFLPIYGAGKNGEKVCTGILGLELKKEWFISFVQSIATIDREHIFMINKIGNFLYHPRQSVLKENNVIELAKKNGSKRLEDIGNKMLNKESGFTEYSPLLTNNQYYMYYLPVPNMDCYLAVLFKPDEIFNK